MLILSLKDTLKGISWIYGPYKWIRDTLFNGNPMITKIALLALVVIILLVIILIIVLKSKKKKAAKKVVKEESSKTSTPKDENVAEVKEKINEEPTNEETKVEEKPVNVEEVKPEKEQETVTTKETTKVSEENVVEKEEEKTLESKEVVKEESTNVEETKVEEEPLKTSPKPTTKKAAVAKTTSSKKIVQENKTEEKIMMEEENMAKKEEVKTSNVQGKFEVYPVGDVFMYRLKASNGEILVTSELYKSLKGAKDAIDTVIKNVTEGTISVTKDKHNLYQFKLFGTNKRLLVASANYDSQVRCESAAESFKKFAVNAKVVELEEDKDQLMEEITLDNKNEKKAGGKLVISVDEGEYDFKLKANNGKVIASSEIYKTKAGVISGIDTFRKAIADGKFFVSKDKRNGYQFKLYSSAGRAIVYGEVYNSKATAVSAASSVAAFIDAAEMIDETKVN